MKKVLMTMALAIAAFTLCGAKDYTSVGLGLKADGKTLNTKAIQKAIDRISAQGGGTLTFKAGTYLTGALCLKDNVALYLEKDATLLGSTAFPDYYKLVSDPSDPYDLKRRDSSPYGFILAKDVRNISISGEGTIDGQGHLLERDICERKSRGEVVDPYKKKGQLREVLRPKLFFFHGCEGVRISGLSLKASACWGLSFENCNDMNFSDLHIFNMASYNNDGIDLSDCTNVTISGCDIDCGDDGICFKSYPGTDGCRNVKVSDCTIRSSASAVKFGTNSFSGFRDFEIRNIKVYDTFRSCIAIECVDGGTLENILVDGIVGRHTGNAIFIKLGKRHCETPGVLKNIVIRNVDVETCAERGDINRIGRPEEGRFYGGPGWNGKLGPLPSSISGVPGSYVQDVLLENIHITAPGYADKSGFVGREAVPENENRYPEYDMYGQLPSWGIYMRHVDGIQLRNVSLGLQNEDYRDPIVVDDVKNFSFENLGIQSPKE